MSGRGPRRRSSGPRCSRPEFPRSLRLAVEDEAEPRRRLASGSAGFLKAASAKGSLCLAYALRRFAASLDVSRRASKGR